MKQHFIALDIDGTLSSHDGSIHPDVQHHVRRVSRDGHHVVLATGRSPHDVLPIVHQFEIEPEWLVCANGTVILHKDPMSETGYAPIYVESFNPHNEISALRKHLPNAIFAVEVFEEGYYYTEHFELKYIEPMVKQVSIEELNTKQVIRMLALPSKATHSIDDLREIINTTGVGVLGQAPSVDMFWVEVFPTGITKAHALEKIRQRIGIPHSDVMAMGDGFNDIEMLQWAGRYGRGIAMGQAHDDVKKHATEVTLPVHEGGVAHILKLI